MADTERLRCVVIGGGFVGLSTAYRLQQSGYAVTVLEKHPQGAAREMSYLNGGLLCPSLTMPWCNWSSMKVAVKGMLSGLVGVGDGTIIVRPAFRRSSREV